MAPLDIPSSPNNKLKPKKSVDVPFHHGFSQSPSNAHIVVGSVGRSAIADPHDFHLPSKIRRLSISAADALSPLLGTTEENDEDVFSDADNRFIVTPQQAKRLADEERELLERSGVSPDTHANYGATGNSSGDTETMAEEEQEVLNISKVWDEAVSQGQVSTDLVTEFKFILKNSAPLMLTFLLQCSLTVASIFTVGHLGKAELAAASLGSMTANITGFALIQGLATCLDTLCAQSYGAGQFHQVGGYFQKGTLMIFTCFFPVGVLWVFSRPLLRLFVGSDGNEETEALISLAATYLRIVLIGSPGYILFECGKRFVQAQGIFHASTYVLVIVAPINALLNYALVWTPQLKLGFIGAPIAVAIAQWMMAILLFLYVYFIDGKKCWDGFNKNVFSNWLVMFKLAIPGVIMIEAEFLAFEILTLAASRLGTTPLAAQSIITTTSSLLYQVPFAMSIAASTRVANFIGASLGDAAKITKRVSMICMFTIGFLNSLALYIFRYHIGNLFSNDPEVVHLVAITIPALVMCAFFDAPNAVLGGILRGLGRQSIGGYLNLFAYYVVGIPISLITTFKFDMGLKGLWIGIGIGLMIVDLFEFLYVEYVDFDKVVEESLERQRMERIVQV